MKVTVKENVITISFKYDRALVEHIKQNFLDRNYNSDAKTWSFPTYKKNIMLLKKLGWKPIDNVNIIPSITIFENEDTKMITVKSFFEQTIVNMIRDLDKRLRKYDKPNKCWYLTREGFSIVGFQLIRYIDTLNVFYVCMVDLKQYLSEAEFRILQNDEKTISKLELTEEYTEDEIPEDVVEWMEREIWKKEQKRKAETISKLELTEEYTEDEIPEDALEIDLKPGEEIIGGDTDSVIIKRSEDIILKKFSFLRNYQVKDVDKYIKTRNILNCNDMGLGKTIETGAYLKIKEKSKILIIALKAVLNQWKMELYDFFKLRVAVLYDDKDKRIRQIKSIEETYTDKLIIAMNYEKLRTEDVSRFILANHFDILVLDEISKIKNGRTKIHKMVKSINADKIIGLTGTPIENHIQDLYSIMNVIDYRFFGRFVDFAKEYLEKDVYGGYNPKIRASKKLGEKMKEFNGFIRWKKDEVLDELPEVINNTYNFELSKRERKLYDSIIYGMAKIKNKDDKYINLGEILPTMQVLRRAVSDVSIYFRKSTTFNSSKQKLFLKILEEIDISNERKVIIFSQYKDIINFYASEIKLIDIFGFPLIITGDTKEKDRESILKAFKNKTSGSNILFCTDVFSHGINLQEASYLINIDLPWNPAILAQRIGRLHRIGQKNPVNVINLIAEDTIEESVLYKILTKKKMFEEIITINEKSIIKEITEKIKIKRDRLALHDKV